MNAVVSPSPSLPLGIIRGLLNDEYHADRSAVSSSRLKGALVSGQHFLAGYDDEDSSTEAKLYGSVLHGFVLEPDKFDASFFGHGSHKRNTTAGKAAAELELVAAGGRTMFPADWLPTVRQIAANLKEHADAAALVDGSEAEVAFVWVDQATGLRLKIKTDLINFGTGNIADLKSTLDPTRDAFSRTCVRYNYPLSAAMYVDGVQAVTGEKMRWNFIAAEKTAPNSVAVYLPSTDFMARGHKAYRKALDNLARWRDRGDFPPLQEEGRAQTIELPNWY